MPTAQRDVRWEALLTSETRFRRIDAEALVFNPFRWETQLLTSLSAVVFEALKRSPATAEEVAVEVAALQPAGVSPAEVLERVREILDELNRFGLIRPCADGPDETR